MKRLGVFLLPPGWGDASPSQGYPPAFSLVPIHAPGLVIDECIKGYCVQYGSCCMNTAKARAFGACKEPCNVKEVLSEICPLLYKTVKTLILLVQNLTCAHNY